MTNTASLPTLYAKWVHELLGGQIPAESNASCEACAMIASDSSGTDVSYNPATKCCTYLPTLWNFLIGGVLLDNDPAAARGRATAEARIDRRLGVTPLGLRSDPGYQLLYESGGVRSFGQSESLLCPHYVPENGGQCGVWRHRESTCATWFCKYVRGAVGRTFWTHLNQLLGDVEEAVAAWCVLELGVGGEILERVFRRRVDESLSAHDVDRKSNAAETDALWGEWIGREREFYERCARLVAPLVWDDVLRIGGARAQVFAQTTRVAYERLMNNAAPERPEVALVQITPRPGGRVRLKTYSNNDLLESSTAVTRILPYFDGRPLAEALDEIRRAERQNVDPALVRKLADFGVLRNAGSGGV